MRIFIDAEMFLFEGATACEKEIKWSDSLHTLHSDAEEVKALVDKRIREVVFKVLDKLDHKGEYKLILCMSDKENFRKKILPTYKANRIGKRKPLAYTTVAQWLREHYTIVQLKGLEADDCIGILASSSPSDSVIISGDKDFQTIPGRFYDYRRTFFHETTIEQANYAHLYQTLCGDSADNYKGCPGIGPKTAEKLLNKEASWETVVAQFIKSGLNEEAALTQARVAYILRKDDYDFKTQEVRLWKPSNIAQT